MEWSIGIMLTVEIAPLVFVFISGRTIVADDSYLKDHPICRDVTSNCP